MALRPDNFQDWTPDLPANLAALIDEFDAVREYRLFGRVTAVLGLLVEVSGIERRLSIGDRCVLLARKKRRVACEVIGFRNGRALLMPFGSLEGVGIGCVAEVAEAQPVIHPCRGWLGRVINALGEPIDGKGPLPLGGRPVPLRNQPPPAHTRARVGDKIDVGVRALNGFVIAAAASAWASFPGRASANRC